MAEQSRVSLAVLPGDVAVAYPGTFFVRNTIESEFDPTGWRHFGLFIDFVTLLCSRPMELVITLLLVGGILLLLETVLPGMIAGLVGAGCVMAGVILGYIEFGAQTGTWILLGVSTALVAGFCVWAKFFPDSRFGRALISKQVVGELGAEQPGLLHHAGTAFTQLRPSGTALIDGRRVDVVTEGALIEKGTPITVVAVEGMRVVVRAVTDDSLDNNNSPS